MAITYDSAITDAYSEELLKLIRDEGKVRLVGSNATDLIMLPREKYEEMAALVELIESELVKEGLRDIRSGKTVPADEAMCRLGSKYSL